MTNIVNNLVYKLYLWMIKSKWFFNKWYVLAGYEVVLDDERSGNIAGKEVCVFNLKPVELNVSDVELFGYKADKVGHNVVAKGLDGLIYNFDNNQIIISMSPAYKLSNGYSYNVKIYNRVMNSLKENAKELVIDYLKTKSNAMNKQ